MKKTKTTTCGKSYYVYIHKYIYSHKHVHIHTHINLIHSTIPSVNAKLIDYYRNNSTSGKRNIICFLKESESKIYN